MVTPQTTARKGDVRHAPGLPAPAYGVPSNPLPRVDMSRLAKRVTRLIMNQFTVLFARRLYRVQEAVTEDDGADVARDCGTPATLSYRRSPRSVIRPALHAQMSVPAQAEMTRGFLISRSYGHPAGPCGIEPHWTGEHAQKWA